jgi:S-adenosylmethionine-diacylgycerolhomoserine-N-methlytransferase
MSTAANDHAELMDSVYRYQRYFYDFTRKYYLLGRDRLINEMDLPEHAAVLEVGCGTARNLIKLARKYPTAKLYGLDASAEMLKTAISSLKRAGLSERTFLQHAYAEDLSLSMFDRDKPFDAVFFSYSLSMIPNWRQALISAADLLAPNGKLHVVDFADLGGSGILRAVLLRWLSLFHVVPREELLRTFERRGRDTNGLRTTLGRYAFLFSTSGQELDALVE